MNTLSAAQAVEALIHQYSRLVFHTIYGLTNDWEESQDLTQDTFHQALKGIEAARAKSRETFQPRAWLLSIAVNTVRMQQRRKKLLSFLPFSSLQGKESNSGGLDETLQHLAAPVQPSGYGTRSREDPEQLISERDAVQRTLAALSEPLRVCLVLAIIGEFSTAEIAAMLDIQEAAVRQRLARARKQFQTLYIRETGEQMVKGPFDSPRPSNGLEKTSDGDVEPAKPNSQVFSRLDTLFSL